MESKVEESKRSDYKRSEHETKDFVLLAPSLPPRPGSAMSRPGTAKTFSVRNDESKISSAILHEHMSGDSLLRILDERDSSLANEALLYAETGNYTGIKTLLESGLDLVSVRGMGGYNLLHHACNRGHAVIVNELLRKSFPTSSRTDSGDTPLHLAVYSGNLLIVEQLIDCGADIDAVNDYNESPLFYAARRGYPALVRMLTQRGADITITDRVGDTAIEHCSNEHTRRAFETHKLDYSKNSSLSYSALLLIFQYLPAKDVCRAACVSGKWHRVSENEAIWAALKMRRWECALQSSLGFGQLPSASFARVRRNSSESSKSKSR